MLQTPTLSGHGSSPSLDIVQQDARELLKTSLKGCRVFIPDLHLLFAGWGEGVNGRRELLRIDVEARLRSLFPAGKRLDSLLAADAGNFAAQWWPDAEYEQLKVATWLSIWLFAWDDETDSTEFSNISESFQHSQKLREQTLRWCRHTLGLSETKVEPPTNPLIRSFEQVGRAIFEHNTLEQRQRLMSTIEFFVNMSEVEQVVQLSQRLPTVQEYSQRRMGTSAVLVCLAITEYAYDISLPVEMIECADMETLWGATNVIISTCNDILSVRKEVANGQVDSLVPLLFVQLGDAQRAIDAAVEQVQLAASAFEAARSSLRQTFKNHVEYSKLDLMIRGCETACTANLNWSLVSPRYRLPVSSLRGGATITL